MESNHDAMNNYGAAVLAVCGFSGSGKTTLLESVIPKLVARGLAVAVVKHDAHGFVVDKPGKDSDRLFRAGATVALRGPEEQFERRAACLSLDQTLRRLGRDHDLLLVEGHKDTPLPKVWLKAAEHQEIPESVSNVVLALEWDADRVAVLLEYVDQWLPAAWKARPVFGGLLMGGMSSRMGLPKQMVPFGGRTLGEIAADALGGTGSKVIALGAGMLPDSLKCCPQVADAPELAGPGAGLITAHRWAPDAAWIVCACDHPWVSGEHIAWLIAQRRPGKWAVIPKQRDGHACLVLALYEPQALEYLERRALAERERNVRPLSLLKLKQVVLAELPEDLEDGWKNVNTPEQLRAEEKLEVLRGEMNGAKGQGSR